MILPELALAPVILPVIVPSVHAKLLAALDVKDIFGPVPLQMLAALVFVTDGIGFTVTIIVEDEPTHDPIVDVGVII